MPDEKDYTSHIVDVDVALQNLRSLGDPHEAYVLQMAHEYWKATNNVVELEALRLSGDSDVPPQPI